MRWKHRRLWRINPYRPSLKGPAAISDLPHVTLVLGGVRSGKSRHAEQLLTGGNPAPWIYIATAQALDDEMRTRIAEHRLRRGAGWRTVEAPIDLTGALLAESDEPVLVDCLTLWLTNLILGDLDIPVATTALEDALSRRRAPTVLAIG